MVSVEVLAFPAFEDIVHIDIMTSKLMYHFFILFQIFLNIYIVKGYVEKTNEIIGSETQDLRIYLYNITMIHHYLRQRKFINECIDMLTVQYSQNRQKLRKLLNSSYDIPDPISSIVNLQNYLYKPSDVHEVNKLVREQIKINRLVTTGKEMLNIYSRCDCHK